MQNKIRQEILKELKILLNEAPPNPGEAEAVSNIINSQVRRWMNGKLSDESFKSILMRGVGSGGTEGQVAEKLFSKLAAEKAKGTAVDTIASIAEKEVSTAAAQAVKTTATAAAETAGSQLAKKAGTEIAGKAGTEIAGKAGTEIAGKAAAETAGKTAIKALTTQAAESTTLALAKNQAGKAIVKSAVEKAAAEGLARVALGQAVGSAVPGVGNIVMGVIMGAWLGYDIMMAYVDYNLATSGQNQRDAMANVRKKCQFVKSGKSPEGNDSSTTQELLEMAKDFAAAISFNIGYLKQDYYIDCLSKISSFKGVKEQLIKSGINFDILSKDEMCKYFNKCEDGQPSKTPEESEGATPAEVPGQSLKISCKRCKGLGKGCPESKDVRELQDTLAKLKFMNQQEAGFGDATEAAVKAFQKSKKLKDDGIVGPRTCVALGLIKPAAKKAPAPVAAQPEADTRPHAPDVLGPANPKPGIRPAKESQNYYDNKKIKNAEVLFEKLIKVSTNKGIL